MSPRIRFCVVECPALVPLVPLLNSTCQGAAKFWIGFKHFCGESVDLIRAGGIFICGGAGKGASGTTFALVAGMGSDPAWPWRSRLVCTALLRLHFKRLYFLVAKTISVISRVPFLRFHFAVLRLYHFSLYSVRSLRLVRSFVRSMCIYKYIIAQYSI